MLEYKYKLTNHSTFKMIMRILKKIDNVISIDPEVFIKSDWPYLWKKN